MNRALTELPNGDLVDAAVGYRAWRLRADAGEVSLLSMFGDLAWPAGGVVEASCGCRLGHTCGIYAFSDPARLRPQNSLAMSRRLRLGAVVGEVRLWGTVRVHTDGLRGWWAKPASLLLPRDVPPDQRLLVELAARQYGVPLVYDL